jgi:hypothetical protein
MVKRTVTAIAACSFCLGLLVPSSAPAKSYEEVRKTSIAVHNVKRILRPFVATCDRERNNFRRQFCIALNERLKAQHQSKVYRTIHQPSAAGPLVVRFRAKPKPSLEIEVRGCLTCRRPLLDRKGGDVSKGRFFLFKVPKQIKIQRGRNPYDLGDIDIKTYKVSLPAKTTEKEFKKNILPHLRLELLFRPVAGVTMVGARRFKYGVINFELIGHRVVHKCAGKVYGCTPKMAKRFVVDKNDLSCPQNQPRKAVAKVKLPSTLPQRKVKELMELVSHDLQACYEQFGKGGRVPTDLVVASSGRVKHVKVVGSLAGTPTGACVERLVKGLSFPKFSGDDARLQWPFTLSD